MIVFEDGVRFSLNAESQRMTLEYTDESAKVEFHPKVSELDTMIAALTAMRAYAVASTAEQFDAVHRFLARLATC
jgi:hypothetical protein